MTLSISIRTTLAALLVAAGLALVPMQAAPSRASFGPNVRVNKTATDHQQEPSLAVNPKDPRMIVAAAKDWRNGLKEVWHYHSTDSGATWTDVHLPGLPAELINQSDPVVIYDADGVLYTSIIAYNQEDFSKGGLYVARSTDNGATWSESVLAAANTGRIFNDKEWLTVDRSSTATRGTLYLTWTRFTNLSAREERGDIVASTSTDGGRTWSAAVQVSNKDEQDDVQGSFPAVGPDGALDVLYYDQTRVQSLWVARSTDRGRSFAPPVKAADVSRPPSPYPTSKFRVFVLPALAANPVDGTLVAVWGDYTGNSEVRLVVSRDGGRTWSAPVRVNDDSGRADQFFPTAVFDPDGVLHLAWLDRRDDPKNLTYSTYYTQSTDGGRSFAANVRIADAQSDPGVGFEGTLIGDYIQVDAVSGRAWVAWIDTRTGDQDIYLSSISGALTGGPRPNLTPPALGSEFADASFRRVWERADRPVAEQAAARPWLWGPAPFAAGPEAYAQGLEGRRLVQYFDKARMEINNPAADPRQKWFVTNGLLVVEMMSGRVQVGDNEYEVARPPATMPVAGDADSSDAPTYAGLAAVASLRGDNRAADRTGQAVIATLSREGVVGNGPPPIPAAPAVRVARYEPTLGHNIPDVFERFMAQQGVIYEDGKPVQGVVVDPLFDLGYPITEAYWVSLRIAGQEKWALLQAYQRRVLTYVPDNAPAWQVEMGNVGRHYYEWRYGQ